MIYSVVIKVRVQPRLFWRQKTLLYKCRVGIIVTMKTDSKKCFFCDLVIAKNKIATVDENGLKSIISASKKRNDNKRVLREDKKNITVYESCRKNYTRSSTIQKLKCTTSMMDEKASPSNAPSIPRRKMLRKEGDRFHLRICCLFCGEEIVEEKEKKPEKYRRHIYEVRSIEFKDSVLNICVERTDETAVQLLND